MKMGLRGISIFTTALLLCAIGAAPSNAAAAAGSKCTKKNIVVHDAKKNIDLRCTLLKKKLVWLAISKSSSTSGQQGYGLLDSAQIPNVIENWGLNLKSFDPTTGYAGVMKVSGVRAPQFSNPADTEMYKLIVSLYGDELVGRRDPQMSLIAPLGTDVISMVTGVVCDLPKLYSGDYSVRVALPGTTCSQRPSILFEHEHLIQPRVKVGDKVNAGQVLGKVSDYKTAWTQLGFGIIEIGIWFGKKNSSLPWHACPSSHLKPTMKTELVATLTSIMSGWMTSQGDAGLYDFSKQNPIGCLTSGDIQG